MSLGCTVGTRPAPAPAQACAPGNASWGCQSTNVPPQGPVANNPVPPASQVPTQTVPVMAPTQAPAAAQPVLVDDPINRADIQYQRSRVLEVNRELVAALPSSQGSRVSQLPLTFDSNPREVNAYAACTRSGKATIAITDGMLALAAYLAQLQAVDEALGSRHFDEYVALVARNQSSQGVLVAPRAEWCPVELRNQASKVSRQHQLDDEIMAFVIAHELGHHYLNHLPCTSILPLNAAEIGLLVTDAIPAFNQPNEVAADVAGINNVLQAGRRRTANQLSETGALLVLRFFQALDQASPDAVFNFERTHPPPSLREPIVRTAAQTFRVSGGVTWPF